MRFTDELRRLAFENHDFCCACSYVFKEGDTTFLGFDKYQTPLYVCSSCSERLSETVVRIYFTPRPYKVPDNESVLWRYMDFTKYMSLLSTRKLYFPRSDFFDDIFEGAKGYLSNKDKWDSHYYKFFYNAIKNPPENALCVLSEEEIDRKAKELLINLEKSGLKDKKSKFISCWHENKFESEAMWRLYSSFLPNAVAIKSSYSRLYDSLGKNPAISIGRVEYVDLKSSFSGVNSSFWKKRKSFEHEKEVRAIITDYECDDFGKNMNCELNILVEELLISPSSPQWFYDLVVDVNNKFNIHAPVKKSELREHPFY